MSPHFSLSRRQFKITNGKNVSLEYMVVTCSQFDCRRNSDLLLFSYSNFQQISHSLGSNEEQQFCLIIVIRKYWLLNAQLQQLFTNYKCLQQRHIFQGSAYRLLQRQHQSISSALHKSTDYTRSHQSETSSFHLRFLWQRDPGNTSLLGNKQQRTTNQLHLFPNAVYFKSVPPLKHL